jgi:DNA-binding response OmpR family regulator
MPELKMVDDDDKGTHHADDRIMVLIVDDDEMVRKMLVGFLSSPQFCVATAVDGNDALAYLGNNTVDLVITDLVMPNREGIETIFEIKKSANRCPIIAISGGGRTGNMDYLELAQKIGADKTIEKPFRKAELIAAISDVLGKEIA